MKVFTVILICLFGVGAMVSAWEGKIVFEDNFDGPGLDLSKWEYQEDNCDGRFGTTWNCYVSNNVEVKDSKLVITAKPEEMNGKKYTSGRIRQLGEGFRNGAFVVRARLARGDHLWPAMWLLPLDNNCRYEEIDIGEYRGQASEAAWIEVAAHWGNRNDNAKPQGEKVRAPSDLSSDFHEFAVLWLADKLQWYIDDNMVKEYSMDEFTGDPSVYPCDGQPPTPFLQKSNFILNMAVGGSFFDKFPSMDPNTWSKPTMEVDWVRVYQG